MATVIHQCDNCKQNFKKNILPGLCYIVSRIWCLLVTPVKRHSDVRTIWKYIPWFVGKINQKHCHECKKDFCTPYNLKKHLEQEGTYICENCKKVYHRKNFYHSHIIKCNFYVIELAAVVSWTKSILIILLRYKKRPNQKFPCSYSKKYFKV